MVRESGSNVNVTGVTGRSPMKLELPEGTVTVLFTDVVGSTDLTARRGDEAAQEILRAQRELVRQQVGEHSGHEVKSIGDGFMVAFASARRAVSCAVGIQRALEEHNRSQPLDEQVRVRVGMNTGEVLQEEADLFGEAVNAAARIAAKAKGGQILVSETVRGVMGRAKDVQFGRPGPLPAQGLLGALVPVRGRLAGRDGCCPGPRRADTLRRSGERLPPRSSLLDRLTHRCHIIEFQGDSYRFKESLRRKEKARG